MAEVNIPGLIGIIVSYVVLLGIGVYAAKKRGKGAEEMMLAGRSLGLCLGICTMTATWVGGGYILGTAEMVYDPSSGVAYAFAMWAGPLSMFINGYFFANKIRTGNYVTMLDPFQEKYGSRMSGLLFIPTALGEMFWAASVFYGLGTTFSVVVGLDKTVSVLMSVGVTVIYSMTGGLYSVAFTDVIQLAFIFVGLWLSLPFASTHPAVSNIVENSGRWVGQLHIRYIGVWLDYSLMAVMGSIPWQEYYQRVLACKSTREARILTYTGGVLSTVLFALPAMLLGAVGACTDWSHPALRSVSTDGFNGTAITFENSLVLPMVLQYLTPTAVTFIALGAVAAAVMSSADSILIASSTLFAHNVYKLAFRQTASDKEIVWVMRIALFTIGACAAAMAIMVQSVVYLFYLCADIVYVVLFPQFCSIMYLKNTNTYGALAGYVVSIVLRMLSGDPSLGVKPVIKYPYYSPEEGQLLPFRTFSMLAGWITLILVSHTADYLFKNRIVSPEKDIFRCFNRQIQVRVAIINTENENDGNSGRDFNRNEVDKNVTDTQTEEKVPLRSKVEMCSENGDFTVRTRTLSNVKLEEQV